MSTEIVERIRKALLAYDGDEVLRLASVSVEEGIDPLATIDALSAAITNIGERFGSGELWLPDLLRGASAMNRAMPLLRAAIEARGDKARSRGSVVVGTVFGDIHSIGLDIVSTLLGANGFEVKNLGVNVSAETFIDVVRSDTPDILGMSALLTTTAPEQKRVIDHLVNSGLRPSIKVMVGGSAITEIFAAEIGADGYAPNAPLAVELAVELMSG